jgi:hypothetical protein
MIRPDVDEFIKYLNDLLEVDRYAIAELLCMDVPCNLAMAEHPTVQVRGFGSMTYIAPDTYRLGILGLLNGYFGVIENGPNVMHGPIQAIYEHGQLVRFERTPEHA